jgi:RNA polymerase-binding protein DksA
MTDEAYKNKLIDLKNQLGSRHARVKKHVTHADGPVSADLAEQAAERENDDVVFALNDSLAAEIAAIDAALQRLAAGRFGICTVCGEQIERDRLDALPYAATCISCMDQD